MTTAYNLIRENCNDDDDIHAILPTEREGPRLYALVIRVQPSTRRPNSKVVQIRSISVDEELETAEWTSNGIWFPVNGSLPLNLGKALVATHSLREEGRDEPLISSGMNLDDDDLARRVLGMDGAEPVDDEADEEIASTSSTSKNGATSERNIPEVQKQTFLSGEAGYEAEKERERTVECMACGGDVEREAAMRVNFGGEDLFRHPGACPEEEE
jgi:hypothetical protein